MANDRSGGLNRCFPPVGLAVYFGLALCCCCLGASFARAGLGPENLVVVVNSKSADSRTIANHYVQLRNIPSRNVIFLDDVPEAMITDLESFRLRILKPLLEEIDRRGLANHIHAIAYSAGFPYAVNLKEHRERIEDGDLRKAFTGTGSINGLTYLFRFILADKETYLSPSPNFYVRAPWERQFDNPFNEELGELFEQAKTELAAGDAPAAAEKFGKLFDDHPSQAPLAIMAAQALAQAGKLDESMGRLQQAAAALWSSGRWLEQDESLAPLRDREDFRQLVAQLGDAPAISQHAIGFDAARGWTRNGWWNTPELGVSYLPSTMLAVTRGKGTTVEEAIEYLTRASQADNTFPAGTVYLTKTSNVRTKTRWPQFAEAMLYLKWLKREVKVEKSVLPENADDVIGVTFGTASFDWPASGSSFLPGAIADNLTSTSGVMKSKGQTKLTELLKSGAAIASGTVTEPYALQIKFPLPSIHAFYAAGVSAVEAYYLSLASPYQLLIVGDPLCQPFARQPAETISGSRGKADGEEALLFSTRQPKTPPNPAHVSPLSRVEIYIDGKLLSRSAPLENYRIKIGSLAGGAYELRVVLIGEPRTAPRKTIRTWFESPGLLTTPTAKFLEINENVAQLELAATGADEVQLLHFDQVVGTILGDEGTVAIDLQPLGRGPIRLRAQATFRGTTVPGREFVVNY